MSVFHCDNCKRNSKQDSAVFYPDFNAAGTGFETPNWKRWKHGDPCPACGEPIQEYYKFGDWE